MILDEQEGRALTQFMKVLEDEHFESHPSVETSGLARGAEGQILVPVVIDADEPSAHLAMLMAHKAEQLYRQTGCRFVVLQRLRQDPEQRRYLWTKTGWTTITG